MQSRHLYLFTPLSVTIITTLVYFAIVIPLIVVHETVPKAPSNPTPYAGVNLTEAWLDLSELTNGYHPYNSRRNDEIRDWLLRRISAILKENGAKEFSNSGIEENLEQVVQHYRRQENDGLEVIVFSDLVANYTGSALTNIGVSGRKLGISNYFEGTNIIVYIRGTEDEPGNWWDDAATNQIKTYGKGGVMVNAHYDSVSTGYGATDDGVGVITALQLVEFFSTPVNTPKKGVVVLFNNGEEDGLYGAKAFLSHPMASFVHTFLNLEGAGAGGRATLFRATDLEVTTAYGKASHPFGTSISADGFSSGFIRSETDYVVFRAEGLRGLDVAFWEPRARYHTDQDDAKHTSIDSLWHMLSQSVSTVKDLSSDTSKRFNGERRDHDLDKVQNGKGTAGVWFDLFGTTLASFSFRSLFAWSVTILVVTPLILAGVTYVLIQQDRYYFFSGKLRGEEDDETHSLDGWRGFFRFPIAFAVAVLLNIGAAFLVRKLNPFIVYSSPYSVWIMSLSLYFISFWFIMAGCNFMRPSALHRGYALMWMYIFGWILLFVATIFEDQFKISAGYLFVFYESGIFLAFLITLCEFFALRTKSSFVEAAVNEPDRERTSTDRLIAPSSDEIDPTETTPLVGGDGHRSSTGTTFAEGYRRHSSQIRAAIEEDSDEEGFVFGREQKWSVDLPTWTWLIQFLLICPFVIIIIGQVGLLLITAINQTGTDGSSLIMPFLLITFFSVLLLWPIGPFAHRLTHHIPSFLFLVFVGTLIYNLVAFPFSMNNRYKAYFQQNVDLDTGVNTVILAGQEEYIRNIISYIPSASGQKIECESRPQVRSGLKFCSWEGLSPNVVPTPDGIPPEKGYRQWLSFNVTRVPDQNKATFHILGQETKECILRFDGPFSAFRVHGAAEDDKFGSVPESGSDQLKLWHRDWNKEWVVDIQWPVSERKLPGDEGIQGRVACQWSDQNVQGRIPALEEIYRFAPSWSGISKLSEGLVEGTKAFVV